MTQYTNTTAPVDHAQQHTAYAAVLSPFVVRRELNTRSLYAFLHYFWEDVASNPFVPNWHIEYLCNVLMVMATRVAERTKKEHDLIINIPPGTTKTIICSIMFPVWCWTQWPWMHFITASYSARLSLEAAERSRDLIRSARFRTVYPELGIREDKKAKGNYCITVHDTTVMGRVPRLTYGGTRYSTSVGGTLTGFHGDIVIVDDPINPTQAASDLELTAANYWMDSTLPTRKVNKAVTPTILIMQRLHQDDPTGHILAKRKTNIKHICLPGEIRHYGDGVKPVELKTRYVDELLDPHRLGWEILAELEADLGQYGYAGQIGQDPTPPGGGMFHTDHFITTAEVPNPYAILRTVRYWDKAATPGAGAYTVGAKMSSLRGGRFLVWDVRRGRWSTEERERIIRETAVADGRNVRVVVEQEPGSGGKESAEATIRNLAGWSVGADRPTGNKVNRADPYSVQVNNGNVLLMSGEWNRVFVEEHRFFPNGTYKDQVDAAAGAFNQLTGKRQGRMITRSKHAVKG